MGKLVDKEIKLISPVVMKTNTYPCAGCFPYIISFKEIKVGFEQEDSGHKGGTESRGLRVGRQDARLAGAERSLEIRGGGCESQLGVNTEI